MHRTAPIFLCTASTKALHFPFHRKWACSSKPTGAKVNVTVLPREDFGASPALCITGQGGEPQAEPQIGLLMLRNSPPIMKRGSGRIPVPYEKQSPNNETRLGPMPVPYEVSWLTKPGFSYGHCTFLSDQKRKYSHCPMLSARSLEHKGLG